jgi:hypothetical protein
MNIGMGSKIEGIDLYGNNISGVVTNIMPMFGIAQVRYGEDRLQTTSCEIDSITLKNE